MTCKTTGANCPVCGQFIHRNANAKGGRPRIYHDDCRKLQQLFSWLEDMLPEINFDDDHISKVRGDLFRLANTVRRSV